MSEKEDVIFDFDPEKIAKEVFDSDDEKDKEKEEINFDEFIDFNPKNVMCVDYIDPISMECEDLGFDLDIIKRDELYVNLIYFDTNISNSENYKYYIILK